MAQVTKLNVNGSARTIDADATSVCSAYCAINLI